MTMEAAGSMYRADEPPGTVLCAMGRRGALPPAYFCASGTANGAIDAHSDRGHRCGLRDEKRHGTTSIGRSKASIGRSRIGERPAMLYIRICNIFKRFNILVALGVDFFALPERPHSRA